MHWLQKRSSRGLKTQGRSGADRVYWGGLVIASLPGLAALLALLFTWMQVTQANKELKISEQGQITNRFNAAITNLGSTSLDVRLGGIYALERIMRDSARDQPTVVSVVSAYLRTHYAVPIGGNKTPTEWGNEFPPKEDAQAVITVLAHRRAGLDQGVFVDLNRTNLRGVRLIGLRNMPSFRGADLYETDLGGSILSDLDLREAYLTGANLSKSILMKSRLDDADLKKANLAYAYLRYSRFDRANLYGANLSHAQFCSQEESQAANQYCDGLAHANLIDANLTDADLGGMNLTTAIFCLSGSCANLTNADLQGSNLKGAYLSRANLKGAYLENADLTNADLTNADLTNADLTGAKVSGARFAGARLQGVIGLASRP